MPSAAASIVAPFISLTKFRNTYWPTLMSVKISSNWALGDNPKCIGPIARKWVPGHRSLFAILSHRLRLSAKWEMANGGVPKMGRVPYERRFPVDRLFLTTLSLRTIHCVLYSKFDKILQHFLAYLDVRQNFIKWRRGCKDRRPALRHQLAEPTALALTLSRKISGATQPGRSGQIRPPGRRNNQNSQRKDLQ